MIKDCPNVSISELCNAPHFLVDVKLLLTEYGEYLFQKLKLKAGQDAFMQQLITFPFPKYTYPHGTFILALIENKLVGGAGIRKLNEESVEMKRMYVRPEFRGKGAGLLLGNYMIHWGTKHGYKRILLDTNQEMPDAIRLYERMGFKEIPSYCTNENPNPVFMALNL